MPLKSDDKPKRRREVEEDETPTRRSPRNRDEDEDDEPRRKPLRMVDDEDDAPVRRKSRDDEEEEDEPRRKSKVSGWDAVALHSKQAKERKEEIENTIRDFYLTEDSNSTTLQFIDDAPYVVDGHNIKVGREGRFLFTPCQLNKQRTCSMCKEGIKIITKYAFKVFDYRGSWDKDKKKFKFDEPVEKLWVATSSIADNLMIRKNRQNKELSEMVLEVSRSGSGKTTTYNFEQAMDEDDRRLKPRKLKVKFPEVHLCVPVLTDEKLESLGFSAD